MRHSCLTFQSEFHDCCKLSPSRRLPSANSISRGIVGGSVQRGNSAVGVIRSNEEVVFQLGSLSFAGLDGTGPSLISVNRRIQEYD